MKTHSPFIYFQPNDNAVVYTMFCLCRSLKLLLLLLLGRSQVFRGSVNNQTGQIQGCQLIKDIFWAMSRYISSFKGDKVGIPQVRGHFSPSTKEAAGSYCTQLGLSYIVAFLKKGLRKTKGVFRADIRDAGGSGIPPKHTDH
jgi:hypothetical protein